VRQAFAERRSLGNKKIGKRRNKKPLKGKKSLSGFFMSWNFQGNIK
jgi:hypothetical protein